MSAKKKPTSDGEIVITRTFAAPRELVFAAWTEPKHLAVWWGPKGFTNPVCDWDARAGGKIHDVMRAPDGTDHPMGGQFIEVVAPAKLVLTTGALDAQGALMFEFHHTVTFEKAPGGTSVTIRSRIMHATAGADKYTDGYRAGMTSSLEKLAALVEDIGSREIVSTRVLKAPAPRVFGAFSDPRQLTQWWGPKGFTSTFQEFDLRPGGRWRFTLHGPDGKDYAMDNEFTEVVPAERIVFQHHQEGHNFVMSMFFAAEAGGTRLTWRMLFESAAQCVPVRKVIEASNEQNFDRLSAYLSSLP